jgi:hypothetical protein
MNDLAGGDGITGNGAPAWSGIHASARQCMQHRYAPSSIQQNKQTCRLQRVQMCVQELRRKRLQGSLVVKQGQLH